jgi:hypothetical protein
MSRYPVPGAGTFKPIQFEKGASDNAPFSYVLYYGALIVGSVDGTCRPFEVGY